MTKTYCMKYLYKQYSSESLLQQHVHIIYGSLAVTPGSAALVKLTPIAGVLLDRFTSRCACVRNVLDSSSSASFPLIHHSLLSTSITKSVLQPHDSFTCQLFTYYCCRSSSGCFSMIVWIPTVFECLICMRFLVLYLHRSAQLSMFHMEKHSRNTLIIIIIIIIIVAVIAAVLVGSSCSHSNSSSSSGSIGNSSSNSRSNSCDNNSGSISESCYTRCSVRSSWNRT